MNLKNTAVDITNEVSTKGFSGLTLQFVEGKLQEVYDAGKANAPLDAPEDPEEPPETPTAPVVAKGKGKVQ